MANRALKEEGVDDLLPKRSKKEEPTDLAVANEEDTLPKRIFVGNLDMKVTEGHILKIFSKFGTVAQENFLWHHTGPRRGQPRGFCFVTMTTHSQAVAANDALSGRKLKGRDLVVNFATDRDAPPASDTPLGGDAGSGPPGLGEGEDDYTLDRRVNELKMTLERMENGGQAMSAGERLMNASMGYDPTGGREHQTDWRCPSCGAEVFGSKSACFKCGTPRGARGSAHSGARAGGGRGRGPQHKYQQDWKCSGCGALVFGMKSSCYKCGQRKPHW